VAKTFLLEVVTPEKAVFSEQVASIVIPAHEGYLGVLAGHAPMLCTLKPGDITIRTEGGEQHFATGGGFVEITPKRVIVLSESAEPAGDIDIDRAKESRQRAYDRLHKAEKAVDRERAEAALQRAENRLKLAEKYGKK
jgi:F-type H+-transporting ATPase subunit epsilon